MRIFCRRETTGTVLVAQERRGRARGVQVSTDGILTGDAALVVLVLSLSLFLSLPPSKKGRECQSYIRELLGTPNKLAEHVSQNRGYLAGLSSNPLDPFPSRSRQPRLHLSRRVLSLPCLFIVLFVFVSLFLFFSTISLSLFLPRASPFLRRQ